MTVCCLKPGCTMTWARDPVLEVVCPICDANVGVRCKNPSGWTKWGGHNFHAERDILADHRGKYGVCPTARCGLAVAQRPTQHDLFEGLEP